jgi:Flp pilus assembly protein TadB
VSLSSEAVNQAVFVAALFLTFISVPKLIALSIWYGYKELLFWNLNKVMKSKAIQSFTKEGTAEILTKGAESPKLRQDLMIDTLTDWRKDIRDPLIESSTAAVILYLLIPLLPAIGSWLIITLIIIVVVIIAVCVLTVVLWRKSNRLLQVRRR